MARRKVAAKGILESGRAAGALQRYGEALSQEQYQEWWNRLALLAGIPPKRRWYQRLFAWLRPKPPTQADYHAGAA